MVTISHINGDKKVVTKGAYESLYKPLGYEIVREKKFREIEKENIDKDDEYDKDDEKSFDKSSKRK